MHIMPHGLVTNYLEHTPSLAKDVLICDGAKVIGNVTIGTQSNIWFNTVIRGDVQSITVGQGTNIQDNSTVHVTKKVGPVHIGNFVTVGHNAIIHACTVHDYTLIGMGSILLDQVVIPERCIVGAGSVVTPKQSFESGYLIMGSPAKAVRKLSEQEYDFLATSAANYIQTAQDYISHCP